MTSVKRLRLRKPPEIEIKKITEYYGDIGYTVTGFIDRHKFTAGLASGEWSAKAKWNCSYLRGLSFGDEYLYMARAVKAHMDKHYYPLQFKDITERFSTTTGRFADAKAV